MSLFAGITAWSKVCIIFNHLFCKHLFYLSRYVTQWLGCLLWKYEIYLFLIFCLLCQNFVTVSKFLSIFNTLQSTTQLQSSVLNFEKHPSTPTHLHSYCIFRIVELSLHLVWLYVLGGNLVASVQKWNWNLRIQSWHCNH
jgi:hypothetical protein